MACMCIQDGMCMCGHFGGWRLLETLRCSTLLSRCFTNAELAPFPVRAGTHRAFGFWLLAFLGFNNRLKPAGKMGFFWAFSLIDHRLVRIKVFKVSHCQCAHIAADLPPLHRLYLLLLSSLSRSRSSIYPPVNANANA
jgi:hypothetical protein